MFSGKKEETFTGSRRYLGGLEGSVLMFSLFTSRIDSGSCLGGEIHKRKL